MDFNLDTLIETNIKIIKNGFPGGLKDIVMSFLVPGSFLLERELGPPSGSQRERLQL